MSNIYEGNELILEAKTVRDKLELTGDKPEVLRKLNGLLNNRVTWHGGEQAQFRALIALADLK